MPEILLTGVTVAQPRDLVREPARLYLVFNPTRAKLVRRAPGSRVRLAESIDGPVSWAKGIAVADPAHAFDGPLERFPHVLVLKLARGALASPRRLAIESLEERPELVQCVWDLGDDTCVVQTSATDSGCLDTAHLVETSHPQPAGTLVSDVQDYLDEVAAAIKLLADVDASRYASFFFDLDRHTEEELRKYYLAATPFIGAVTHVHPTVHDRLQYRLQVRKSLPNQCDPPFFVDIGAHLRLITDLFFDLLGQHVHPGRPFDLAEVERAFERFASGDLRLRTSSGFWSTQPSSGWYFLFAELALYGGLEPGESVSAGALTPEQRARWRELANVLVRTQELFLRAYDLHNAVPQPCPPPASVDRPKPADYCGCSWLPIPNLTAERTALAAAYAGLSRDALEARATENAAAAFPGWMDDIDVCP